MDPFNKAQKVNVVAIPDYLIISLKANGLTLDHIDSSVGRLTNYDVNKIQVLRDTFKDKLSLSDIADLVVCNNILNENIFRTSEIAYRKYEDRLAGTEDFIKDLEYLVNENGLNEDARKNIISLYCDKDKDVDTIILSKDKSEIEKICSFVQTDDTLFVVAHSGFTNFIVYGGEFKKLISKYIIDKLILVYGEDRAVLSNVFKSFLRLA